jgi:dihydroxyacetone kinase
MPGFSITLLLLPNKDDSDVPPIGLILSLLDDQPDVPGWKWIGRSPPIPNFFLRSREDNRNPVINKTPPGVVKFANHEDVCLRVRKAVKALIVAEPEITRMDSIAGDGDCGLTLKVRFETFNLCRSTNSQTGWS